MVSLSNHERRARPSTSSGRAHRPRTTRLLIACLLSAFSVFGGIAQVEENAHYRPKLAVSETVEPFLKQLEPGSDGFPLERQAQELDARLRELADALRGGPNRA